MGHGAWGMLRPTWESMVDGRPSRSPSSTGKGSDSATMSVSIHSTWMGERSDAGGRLWRRRARAALRPWLGSQWPGLRVPAPSYRWR